MSLMMSPIQQRLHGVEELLRRERLAQRRHICRQAIGYPLRVLLVLDIEDRQGRQLRSDMTNELWSIHSRHPRVRYQ